ncbi:MULTISPECIES: GvpL/GvpF family gas vesicle protein [unclassified Thiocapsa]|uniref:GvpL/GvpF family gas vesicle protein n=2 Tax=Thiocapsa TaxID=1056 RepID=UPI0035AED85A
MSGPARPMLHCIQRTPPEPLARADADLRWIECDGLAALVADQEPSEIAGAGHARLQRYADIVAEIHARAAVIPVRFGCLLAGDDAVGKLLHRYRDRLHGLLDQVGDCLEFGIRLLLPTDAPAATDDAAAPRPPANAPSDPRADSDMGPGLTHLLAIRRRLERDARLAARAREARDLIEGRVAGCYREVREELGQIEGRSLLSLYFLVPRAQGEHFVECLRQDASSLRGTGLLTGPWPPYNFVGAIDDDIRSLD